MKTFRTIGLMSGTSLDGLDIAYCKFTLNKNKWEYTILHAKTYPYSQQWRERLQTVENQSALDFIKTDTELGIYFGQKTNDFIAHYKINKQEIDAIASHGHTIFHRPELGFSTQIANGSQIGATTNITTINDFRSLDVALGGQGAPLVPIGDLLLFNTYDFCLNLGGIANISVKTKNEDIQAFDLCFANMANNYICNQIGLAYDDKGQLAQTGKTDHSLLQQLLSTVEEQKQSLGKEFFTQHLLPILNRSTIEPKDKLHTIGEYLAITISNTLENNKKVLVTGGGAYNLFWIEKIKSKTKADIIIPNKQVIDFKEALIFAFLGVLRLEKQINCLQSVTKATKNSIGGSIISV